MLEEKLLSQDPENQDLEQGLPIDEKKYTLDFLSNFQSTLRETDAKELLPEGLNKIICEYLFEEKFELILKEKLKNSGFLVESDHPLDRHDLSSLEQLVQQKLDSLQSRLSKANKKSLACLMASLLSAAPFYIGMTQSSNDTVSMTLGVIGGVVLGWALFCCCMFAPPVCGFCGPDADDYERILELEKLNPLIEKYKYFLPIEKDQIIERPIAKITEIADAITIAAREKAERAERQGRIPLSDRNIGML